jgi:hypothetical protein
MELKKSMNLKEGMTRQEVWQRFGYDAADVSEFTDAIRAVSEIVRVSSRLDAVADDPKDNMIVNAAASSGKDR